MITLALLLTILFPVVTPRASVARCGKLSPASSSPIASALDDYFARAESFGFSGSVLVAVRGAVVLRKGYGYADRRTGLCNTPETVFGVSSVDKQIIATAIMKLSELGRLRVTDSLGKFFDRLPADKAGITLRQVMSHTSGIPDEYWDSHPDMNREQFVRFVLNESLAFTPGSGWEYSNANFWLLEEVVERASGRPYEQFLDEKLFAPAGMHSTGFPSHGWKGQTVAKYQPWTFDIPKGESIDAEPLLERQRYNWQIMTNVDDLFKWYLALRNNTLISARSKLEMFTPVREQYGYGWNIVPTRRNTRLVYHGGSGDGVGMVAQVLMWVDEDVAVLIFANSTSPAITSDAMRPAIESILFGGNAALPPAGAIVQGLPGDVVGTYALSDGGRIDIKRAVDGRLVAQSSDPGGIVALIMPDAATPFEPGTYNADAEKAIDSAFANDFEPLRKLVRPPESFDERRAQMQRLIKRLSSNGTLLGNRTVFQRGYDRDGLPELQSFQLLRFTSGVAIVRVIQLSSGATYFNAVSLPRIMELPLTRDVGNQFTAWNFLWTTATRFVFSDGPRPNRLDIRGSRGNVMANRK
jgi:CubicO group peptidase (beta-lactamase class C family)